MQSILGHLDSELVPVEPGNLIRFVKIVGRSCFILILLIINFDLPSVDRIYL